MKRTSPKEESITQEPIDLATLGRTYKAPLDTSPEVADVIAGMPWWASHGLLYLIVGFVIAGLLWSALSKIDVVTTSRGSLVPEGYVKPIQAAGPGVVQHLFVREGDVVEAGQALVQMDAAEMRTRLNKLREEFRISEAQWRQYLVKKPVTDSLEQQNRIVRLQSEIAAAQLALQHTTIIAPVAGTVTTLEIRNRGTVLQAGQTVATISQRDARLLVEARVANKDIAFIERGSPVKLKFDAFPFQDYGVVNGSVVQVSPDAQTDKESGSFYKVMILPGQTEINAGDRNLSLRPGLSLTAEIVTERKTILGLILEPFRKLKRGS